MLHIDSKICLAIMDKKITIKNWNCENMEETNIRMNKKNPSSCWINNFFEIWLDSRRSNWGLKANGFIHLTFDSARKLPASIMIALWEKLWREWRGMNARFVVFARIQRHPTRERELFPSRLIPSYLRRRQRSAVIGTHDCNATCYELRKASD